MEDLVSVLSRSLGSAGIYIMIGLGYNAIYATSKVFNLAQGELSVVAMFVGLFAVTALGLPLWVALLVALVLVGLLAVLEEFVAIRPVMRHEPGVAASDHNIAWAITALAFAFILQAGLEVAAGVDPYRFPSLLPDVAFTFLGATWRTSNVSLFVLAVLTAGVLHAFYTRTLTGKALTAMSQDDEAASLRGIPTRLLKSFSFALSGGIAALAAFFIAPITFVYPSLGALYTFKGFVAIAIGGMGNNAGAVVGGILLAVIETVGADLIGAGYRDSVSMVFLLVVLMLWPRGLTGRFQERTV